MKVARTCRQLALAIVPGLVVALVGTDAMAWSYGSWGSSGSYGSYGSSGSSASYGSHGSHGRMGLFARIRARRAARHSHGSYGSHGSSASYGSYGSHGSVSYGSAGSHGGYGSHGSYASTYYSSSHSHYASSSSNTTSYASASSSSADSTATIKVQVPEGATVVVNDTPTKSTGSERSYVSRGLKSGMTYTYKFEVTYKPAGQDAVTEEKVVQLSAGDVIPLSFGETQEATAIAEETEPVETKLTVDVPAKAKVYLLGSQTKQTGAQRTYTTTQLKAGESWDGYQIRVELERDGKTLVREQDLKIIGGKNYELAFSFDTAAPTQIAQLDR